MAAPQESVAVSDRTAQPSVRVDPDTVFIASEAEKAKNAEHSMGLLASLRLYPKAAAWSVLLSTAIVMEGFDLALLGSLYAYPPFQRKFGVSVGDGAYEITANWQTALTVGAQVGSIVGLLSAGLAAERFGYRRTLLGALALVVCLIFIVFFAESLVQLLAGELLLGVPWGAFQALAVTFAADVCPVNLRAYLTSYVNLCWVLGQLIASGVMRAMLDRDDETGFRIPFALQWLWPVPLMVGILLAPESPWWLVRQGRLDAAKRSLLRLTSTTADAGFHADETISMMVHTNALEKSATAGTTYWDCLRGTNRRRTEITVAVETIPQLCGTSLQAYSTYFYIQAGMSTDSAFNMTMIQCTSSSPSPIPLKRRLTVQDALGTIGTLLSWFMMAHSGRRSIYLIGLSGLVVSLLAIGFVSLVPKDNTSAQWAIGTMLVLHTFTSNATVGPVSYTLIAELASTRLKNKTVVMARSIYNIAGIIANVLSPRMLNPSAWNWGAKTAFFWAGLALICLAWAFFRLPEPKGRTYTELDILFEKNVSARSFKSMVVETLQVEPKSDKAKVQAG